MQHLLHVQSVHMEEKQKLQSEKGISLIDLHRAHLGRKWVPSCLPCRHLFCTRHPAFSVSQSFVCLGCFLKNKILSITIECKALLLFEAHILPLPAISLLKSKFPFIKIKLHFLLIFSCFSQQNSATLNFFFSLLYYLVT